MADTKPSRLELMQFRSEPGSELSGPQGRAVVGFEQSRGSLFEMLREQKDWLDLYPLNPLTPTRYRQTFYSSGAKDDPLEQPTYRRTGLQTSEPAPALSASRTRALRAGFALPVAP